MAPDPINSDIDRIDQQILAILSTEGRLSITELAARVGLSTTPCQVRFRRLQQEGYILGFRAVLNTNKLQLDHVAFTEIKLIDTTEQALQDFNLAVRNIREVETCHMIAGQFDYLLKVRTPDIKSYRRVLGQQISTLPNVASSSTYVSMEAVVETGV